MEKLEILLIDAGEYEDSKKIAELFKLPIEPPGIGVHRRIELNDESTIYWLSPSSTETCADSLDKELIGDLKGKCQLAIFILKDCQAFETFHDEAKEYLSPKAVILAGCPPAESEVFSELPDKVRFFTSSNLNEELLEELSDYIHGNLPNEELQLRWFRVAAYPDQTLYRLREIDIQDIIREYSGTAAFIGLTPIPMADMPLLTTLQGIMITRIGRLYGYALTPERARELLPIIGLGFVAREAARQGIKLLPVVGWIISGSVAYAVTMGLGYAMKAYFDSNLAKTTVNLKAIYEKYFQQGKKEYKQRKKELKGK